MTSQQWLLTEFNNEMAGTRRMLERVPRDRFDWRPHTKSFTIGDLAAHIIDSLDWVEYIFASDEFNFDPATFKTSQGASLEALLAKFEEQAAAGTKMLEALDDSALASVWQFKVLGKLRLERPKAVALRDFTLSHIIHHRGQLSVYLRLLDIPVPGVYGPTADEQG